ncbi:PorV/PorQ family protein [Rhodothermus marinus]|uniref:PorV/PorQ family protein n=1 Tax=Rhodothermus marinus TaxID=29549 RepID=UPI0037C793F3
MKRLLYTKMGVLLAGCLLLVGRLYAQDIGPVTEIETKKLAQTGFKFLSVSLDPRAAAMGDALTARDDNGSLSLFYNPAGMAYFEGAFHLAAGQTQWINNTNYNYASLAYRPAGGKYGVIGLSVVAVNYPEVIKTIFAENQQGYLEQGTYSPSAMAVGLGYARAITDRFAVGGHVRLARQDLGSVQVGLDGSTRSYAKSTVAVDFGVLYHTALQSLTFAMSVRNFSRELTYVEESFELPLSFQIGVTYNLMDLMAPASNDHALWLNVEAVRPRDYPEQIKVGLEYSFMQLLYLRAGYVNPTDEQGINLGGGLRVGSRSFKIGVDYAYTSFGIFDNVHRIGLQLAF